MCYQDGEGELVTQSRRSIVQAGAATALLAVLYPLPVLAEPGQSEPDQGETKAEKARADMEAWYRVRGDGFAMSVHPSYEDVVEYDVSAPDHLPSIASIVVSVGFSDLASWCLDGGFFSQVWF
jgi:hypothetical protein